MSDTPKWIETAELIIKTIVEIIGEAIKLVWFIVWECTTLVLMIVWQLISFCINILLGLFLLSKFKGSRGN